MKKTLFVLLAVFALLVSCDNYEKQKEGKEIRNSDHSARIDSIFKGQNSSKFPGYGVLIMEEGEVVHSSGYGMADFTEKRAITPETRFYNDLFLTEMVRVGVFQLIQEGRLNYNDSIAAYLPKIAERWGSDITIQHLLEGTSGLPMDLPELEQKTAVNVADVVRIMAETESPALYAPGEDCSWRPWPGNILLLAVIEEITGKSGVEFFQERFITPLKMTDAVISDDFLVEVTNAAFTHKLRTDGYKKQPLRLAVDYYFSPICYTSINDLAKWYGAFDSGQLLNKESMDQLHRVVQLNDGTSVFDTSNAYYTPSHTAVGFKTEMTNGSYYGFGDGVDGAFACTSLYLPETEHRFFVISNRPDGTPGDAIFMNLIPEFIPGVRD